MNAQDKNGNTPLHVAAERKQYDSVRFLVTLGTNLDITNRMGKTPLHISVTSSVPRIAKELLLKGARRDVRDVNGAHPIDLVDQV